MSSDYIRIQDPQQTKGSAVPAQSNGTAINDSQVNLEEIAHQNFQQIANLTNMKSIRGLTPEAEDGNEIDDHKGLAEQKINAQKETTDFTDQDEQIDKYFQKEDTKSPLVYLDCKTTFDTSFKLSDVEIICFDKERKILKKINMLKKFEDTDKNKTFAKEILISISQEELLKEAVKTSLDEDQNEGRLISEEELSIEKVTRVELSDDKHEIFVGTSFGRIVVISSETFKVYGILRNNLESPVTDIAVKKATLIVAHENGQIILFDKFEKIDSLKPEKIQIFYKKSFLQGSVKSRDNISCNTPQYKCSRDHTLVFHEKDPYGGGARCDVCRKNNCISLGYLYHCPECDYDLCKNCSKDYEKFGKKIEITAKCTSDHTLELCTQDPYEKKGEVQKCDECQAQNIISMGYSFSCSTCNQYDLCAACDMNKNGKKLQPTCNKRHEMKILKEKPSYYSTVNCGFCNKSKIHLDGLFYHCKDCRYDKCYYCKTNEDIIALKTSHLTQHLAVVQRILKETTAKKDLILYNLKVKKGEKQIVGEKSQIYCSPTHNYFFKKLLYFTQENLITRSDNRNSFKILDLKKCKEQGTPPETLDSNTIQKIDIWKDDKTIILISNTGNIYLYDEKGKEKNLSNIQAYFIWGPSDMNLTGLNDKVTILKLPQKIYDQQQIFTELQNNLYFADEDKSFFIELRGNPKPSFSESLRDAIITPDRRIFAREKTIDSKTTVVIYDQMKNEEIKLLPYYELVSCSYHSKYLYCRTTNKTPTMSVQVNLETFEIHDIYECEILDYQVSKDDTLAYIRKQDKESKEYYLYVIDIKERTKLFEYKTNLKTEFKYRLSNDEKYIILTTKEKQLQKIKVINGQELVPENKTDHGPGFSGQISFNHNSSKFMCGGQESSDLLMYDAETLKVLYTAEQHDTKDNFCFFTKANRIVTRGSKGDVICWDFENIEKPIKLFQAQVGMNIYSYNRKLIGFMINGEPRVWNERLMHELSDNIKLLLPNKYEKVQKEKEWIVGPLNNLLPQILQQFQESNPEEQKLRLPHLLKFVILPYGYTFLEKLVFDGKKDLIEAAIQDSNMRYITDVYGNNPLTYALKRKNFEVLNILLDFFIKNPTYIKNLRFIEFISLLKLGPSQITDLLDKFVEPIPNMQSLGKKISENYETYYKFDPLERFNKKKIEEELLKEDAPVKDQFPIIFNRTMMNLRFTCKESTNFYEALDECPCEEIFGTTLIQKIIDYKWSKVKIVAHFFLAFQIAFLGCVTYSSFQPGNRLMLYLMMGFAFVFGLCEFIIFRESKYSFVYIDMFKIVIIILVFTYCLNTLQEMTANVDSLLPFINLFTWFNLVREMKQVERTRQFVCVIQSSIESIAGFLIFLVLMIASFATTSNLFMKNLERHQKFENATEPWRFDEEFFKEHDAKRTLEKDIEQLWMQHFGTWITIVKGDYPEDLISNTSYQLFLLLLTFIANVTLLNLIVAIMSDAYEEIMTSIVAKSTKSLNAMMLRYDKILFLREAKSNQRTLIWVAYAGETAKVWTSQIDAINSEVRKSRKDVLDQFNATEQSILERQKEQANATSTLTGRISTLQSKIEDEIKSIKDTQENQVIFIKELIYHKREQEKKVEKAKEAKIKAEEAIKNGQQPEIVEDDEQNEVLQKLAELENNQKQFQAQIFELIQSIKTQSQS